MSEVCRFDHGSHQFYEGHYVGDRLYIKDKDVDHCVKCGIKK